MTTPINPYVAGNPVGDSPAFIGRADVLREVVRVLRRPQDNAIVLYGQRRIGKTSILQHLTAQLPKEGNYNAVYFDLQDKAAWPLSRVLSELARTIADKLNLPAPDLGADPETAFHQTWLPATLNTLASTSTLTLLLDEFDVLADAKGEQAAAAFFPYLRDLMSSHPQRLKFVFVIGRNVNDLINIALSLFKGTPSQRVSLLTEPDTANLARLAQRNGTLIWPDDAVARVWQLTHGHPFLAQQLCSHVWERTYDQEPSEPPTVTLTDVEAAIPDVLEASRNTMEWLWDGLPPAERVVISALAEAGPGPITQDDLEKLLRDSGVRVLIRELQNAPQLLQEWDLIEPAEGGYCFRVELLRQWIAANKPLRRVQDELDRVEPVAESLYQAAVSLYRSKQLEQAVAPLRQAVTLNPNHVKASQLLADILLAQGQPDEAVQLLERLYEYQPAAARPRLVQAMLAKAQRLADDCDQLALYERVLELDFTQPEAMAGKRHIWQQRGDAAFKANDLDEALKSYQAGGLTDEAAKVEREVEHRIKQQRRLAVWNPLDHLRLLWWVLVMPQSLKTYRKAFGEQDEGRVGNWLVSTLIWLPLLMPTLALGLETLPRTENAWWSPSVHLGIFLGLLLAWAFTGMLGKSAQGWAGLVGCVAGVVAFAVALEVTVGVAAGAVGYLAGFMAGVVAVVVAFGVAGGVVGFLAGIVAGFMAGAVVTIVASFVTGGAAFGVAVGLAIIVAVRVAGGMAGSVNKGLETGVASPLVRGGGAVLVLSYAFLVWFCFLGGWRIFAQ